MHCFFYLNTQLAKNGMILINLDENAQFCLKTFSSKWQMCLVNNANLMAKYLVSLITVLYI